MRKTGNITAAVLLAVFVTVLASGCGKKEALETSAPESTVSQTEESPAQEAETDSSEDEKQNQA